MKKHAIKRKFSSILLAMLMLAMTIFSAACASAEETPAADMPKLNVADVISAARSKSFAAKYLAEGQRETADISFQIEEAGLMQYPEAIRSAVKELADALKIQAVTQMTSEQGQETLRILLNGEEALFITAALGEKGIYLASSLLGDKVIQITTEQIGKVLLQRLQQMKQQEQASGTAVTTDSPQTAIALKSLLSAIEEIGNSITTETVGVVQPADALFTVKTVVTLPLTKEALTKVTTEFGKMLWSIPEVQKAAGVIPNTNIPLTEEILVAMLNTVPDKLADDAELRIYLDETGKKAQIGFDMILIQDDGTLLPVSFAEVNETRDDGMDMTATCSVIQDGIETRTYYEIALKQAENHGSLNVTGAVTISDGEEKIVPMQLTMALDWTDSETARNARMDIRAEVPGSPAAQAVLMTMDYSDKDLGDHAETNLTLSAGTEEGGTLMTVKVDGRTEPAETYIIKDDAVKITELDEEARKAFMTEFQTSVTQAISKLITKLPAAVQQLTMQLMGGTQQTKP